MREPRARWMHNTRRLRGVVFRAADFSRRECACRLVNFNASERRPVYFHPCRHFVSSISSRQGNCMLRFEYVASISMNSIWASGSAGSISLVTRKCFSLFCGCVAVHFVSSSFFAFKRRALRSGFG